MTLDEYFTGYGSSRPVFDAVREAVESTGPVELRVTKSQVAFVRGHPFAWAWVPGRYLRSSDVPLVLSVALRRRDHSPRWKEVVEPTPGRFMHHLELREMSDVDDEVRQWLAEASAADGPGAPRYYHGTRADLKPGDLIEPGYRSNFGQRKHAAYIYLTATLDAATWGAELAEGEAPGRIYVVEPTGPIEDDPNLTDKRFPGNPTRSYRSREPLRVMGEVADWEGHVPEVLQAMKEHLEDLKSLGVEAIED